MEKVVLDGVEYKKASVLAKEYKYTPDYLGQLSRAKKVAARLVGRTWYISEKSLLKHRDAKYQNLKPEAQSDSDLDASTTSKKYTRRVESPMMSMTKNVKLVTRDTDDEVYATVKYEADDFSLVPRVNKIPKISLLKVRMADATNVKIGSYSKVTSKLRPEELPEVSLSGKLTIADIEGIEDEAVDSSIRDNKENKNIVNIKIVETAPRATNVPLKKPSFKDRVTKKNPVTGTQNLVKNSKISIKPKKQVKSASVHPQVLVVRRPKQIKQEQTPIKTNFWPLVIIILCAFCVAFFILTIEVETVFNKESTAFQFSINPVNFLRVFE